MKQIKRGTSGLCGNSRLRGLGSSSDQGGYVIFLGFTFTQPLPIQGPVVRRPISANPGLNFNLNFFIPLFKCLFRIVSGVLYRASNNHIRDKKNPTEFSLKAIRSEIRFHTNPGLS